MSATLCSKPSSELDDWRKPDSSVTRSRCGLEVCKSYPSSSVVCDAHSSGSNGTPCNADLELRHDDIRAANCAASDDCGPAETGYRDRICTASCGAITSDGEPSDERAGHGLAFLRCRVGPASPPRPDARPTPSSSTFARSEGGVPGPIRVVRSVPAGALIVDANEDAVRNGWPDEHGTPGGHIPGSLHVAAEWTPLIDERWLAERGLDPTRAVVVGSNDPLRAHHLAERLVQAGCADVSVLAVPLHEAAERAQLSLDRPQRWHALVPPREVAALMERGAVLLEVAWGPKTNEEHVPGSCYLDTNLIEREPLWRFVPTDELVAVALRYGITKDTPVVLYGHPQMAAARVAVALLYLGVDDVRLLDGGLPAWIAAGLPVTSLPGELRCAASFGVAAPARPHMVVGLDEVRTLVDDPTAVIVCTRSPAEHAGESSGYDEISARGRIRGSVWGRSGSDALHVEHLEDPDGTLRGQDELRALWSACGAGPERRVVFYCGTGWRASLALFHAWVMGWDRAALYDPGWFEWGADSDSNPIDTGPPQ